MGPRAAKSAGSGAAAGGVAGLSADITKGDTSNQVLISARVLLLASQNAVIGEIAESWDVPLDTPMSDLGGMVDRHAKSDVRDDRWDGYRSVLYPYGCQSRSLSTT